MKEITSEVEVRASAEKVWQLLTDFRNYRNWNPFIPRVEGIAKTDARISVQTQPPGGRALSYRAIVVRVVKPKELRWVGRLYGIPGLCNCSFSFTIEPLNGERVTVVQKQSYSGLLVPLLGRMLGAGVQRGLEQMNQALKERAEAAS